MKKILILILILLMLTGCANLQKNIAFEPTVKRVSYDEKLLYESDTLRITRIGRLSLKVVETTDNTTTTVVLKPVFKN